MDTSSEDNFAWTDASSCSNMSDISMENDEQTLNNGVYESEKDYKKKLHQQIGLMSDNTYENKIKQKRKKRIEKEESIERESPRRKHIKVEPESQDDSKEKHNDSTVVTNGYYSSMSSNQEEISETSKKKRKKKGVTSHEESINYCKPDTEGGQAYETLKESHHIDTDHENFDLSKKLSKKRKKKMEQSNHNSDMDMSMEEIHNEKYESSFNGEEIIEKEAKMQKGTAEDRSPENQRNRLIFEEDLDANSTPPREEKNMSSSLKKFLKSKSNLKLVSRNADRGSFITNDDEIWLLKCPHHINIETLKDTIVTINDNMKIKAHHQSYHGDLVKDNSRIALLTWDSKKFLVHHSNLNGTVEVHTRIPMPRFSPGDDATVNDETVFISPPELKCAHPIFGRHYKKRMKTPRAVSQCISDTEEKKKKKHKRERQYSISIKEEDRDRRETEPESQTPVKRKKLKRKNSHFEDLDHSRKAKRVKHEHNSPVEWESAKAIEDSLFNF